MIRWRTVVLGFSVALACIHGAAAGQLRLENLSVSMGLGGDVYGGDGNFLTIAVPQVDSTHRALAASGDMGMNGTLILLARNGRSLSADFDFGMRQFVTDGFQQRNYAPRELSGRALATYSQRVGSGTLRVIPTLESRRIADRPAMPLYLPPGYTSNAVVANYSRPKSPTVAFYGQLTGEIKNYAATTVFPALGELDRRSVGVEAGAQKVFPKAPDRDPTSRDRSTLRVFGAVLHHRYPQQGLGLLRQDLAERAGAELNLDRRDSRGLFLSLQVAGTRSRSNSKRVDYNAARIQATGSVELGDLTQLDLQGLWAVKRYLNEQAFLVPGEEADNATIVFAQVTRFLREGVRAGVGVGWTKAETNISGAYYQRFSVSFSLTVNRGF